MSSIISLYPTYDGDPLHLFTCEDFAFSYEQDGEIYPLEQEVDKSGISGEIVLDDENGCWNPDDYSLTINRKITVKEAYRLYTLNKDFPLINYKVACKNATIGLGVSWSSPQSCQKGAISVGEIKNINKIQTFDFKASFPKGTIRGELNLSLILYIASTGNPTEEENIYANEIGSRIGLVDVFSVRVDGSGSFFPIQEVEKPGETLWSVKCNFTDPSTDAFSDSVAILLNRAHRNFKMLDRSDKHFNPQLFNEVIASAISIIIETLRNDDSEMSFLQDAQEGSVGLAIKYFKEKLGWDISSSTVTSTSIRSFLEQKLLDL